MIAYELQHFGGKDLTDNSMGLAQKVCLIYLR